ncbi:GlxA family transcriptional regulator [Nitratireductor sp. ZSWI3]|uniref:GlxA family transcriptional regulator n=1 Tax=Nitratireductor sp. ZSWI3 TaxID=2966359 RepID=UPI0021505D5C|nr:helix-turn-helix domain-containing protein [Nitratireductor sp. ZSWI3]MCR4266652.1 DJ-1/PfpI family protein [Nitratireductor sp. ZSWI3]
MSSSANTRNIVFVLFDGMLLLDAAGPAEVFSTANMFGCDYRIHYASVTGQVTPRAGLKVTTGTMEQAPRPIHTLFIPGGTRSSIEAAASDERLLAWLETASKQATRVVSICTGAFLLGRIGLLDGRRATTHWASAKTLAAAFPKARIDGEELFVEDGKVWTSAGAATGIDLSLTLVARDAGPDVALKVARALVLHLVRPGSQSQFSAPLAYQARKGGELSRLVPWLEGRLDQPTTVADMADAMGMSDRSFYRHCLSEFDMPPARLLSELRLDRARLLLGDVSLPISAVAHRTGFADAASFTKAFGQRYGMTPSAYRRAFAEPKKSMEAAE